MIKLVVFDIAGTTLQDDNIVFKAFQDSFLEYGLLPSTELINKVMGLSKPTAILFILKELSIKSKINLDSVEFCNHILFKFRKKIIDYYSDPLNTIEIPGTSKTFEELHKKDIKVALDTGFSSDITALIMRNVIGWKDLVDMTVSSDEVKQGRPYPYMIFKIMESLQIESVKEVMKVGDTISDIMEGINAGCTQTIGVLSGNCSREDFQKCQEHFNVVPYIISIPPLLK